METLDSAEFTVWLEREKMKEQQKGEKRGQALEAGVLAVVPLT